MSWGTEKYVSLLFIQNMHQFIFKKKQSQIEDYLRVQSLHLQMYCCNTANVLLVLETSQGNHAHCMSDEVGGHLFSLTSSVTSRAMSSATPLSVLNY